MSLLTAGQELLGAVGALQRTEAVEVLAPTMISNPNFPGQETPDWTQPIVTVTVAGNVRPAGTRALERAGLVGKVGVFEVFTDPTELVPEGRVRVGATTYLLHDVSLHESHSHAIAEEVTA